MRKLLTSGLIAGVLLAGSATADATIKSKTDRRGDVQASGPKNVFRASIDIYSAKFRYGFNPFAGRWEVTADVKLKDVMPYEEGRLAQVVKLTSSQGPKDKTFVTDTEICNGGHETCVPSAFNDSTNTVRITAPVEGAPGPIKKLQVTALYRSANPFTMPVTESFDFLSVKRMK